MRYLNILFEFKCLTKINFADCSKSFQIVQKNLFSDMKFYRINQPDDDEFPFINGLFTKKIFLWEK